MSETKTRGKQGFASMTPEDRKRIAAIGGKRAHALGKAHVWTSEQAQKAGKKGGAISQRRRRNA